MAAVIWSQSFSLPVLKLATCARGTSAYAKSQRSESYMAEPLVHPRVVAERVVLVQILLALQHLDHALRFAADDRLLVEIRVRRRVDALWPSAYAARSGGKTKRPRRARAFFVVGHVP